MAAAHNRAEAEGDRRRIAVEQPGKVYSGSRVDCQATIRHCPAWFDQTSVKRTAKLLERPCDMTPIRADPVNTTVLPRSCAATSDGTTEV